MTFRYLLSAALLVAMAGPVYAQKCDQNKAETTPLSRFKDNGDGTITDTQTKHTWMRCAIGMNWDGSSCAGKTLEYNYAEALTLVDEMNEKRANGRSDWRLPTIEELQSIVEKRCFSPAINLQVFPYSPQSGFWSSTPNEGIQHTRVMLLHFYNGNAYIANKNQTWRIRLIADK